MKSLVKCELLKLKRQKVIPISILITFIPILLGLFNFKANYSVFNEMQVSDWLKAWNQVGMFYAPIIFPIIASVYCAIIFRVEYSNKNFKIMLSTPTPRKLIYISKVIVSALMLLLLQFIFFIAYFMFGKMFGITDLYPIGNMINLLFMGWIGVLPLVSIQIYLSLKYEEFTKSIMIAALCSLGGFFIGAVNFIKYLWPWAIQRIAMDPGNVLGIQGFKNKIIYIIYCLAFTGLLVLIGIKKFEKMEIK